MMKNTVGKQNKKRKTQKKNTKGGGPLGSVLSKKLDNKGFLLNFIDKDILLFKRNGMVNGEVLYGLATNINAVSFLEDELKNNEKIRISLNEDLKHYATLINNLTFNKNPLAIKLIGKIMHNKIEGLPDFHSLNQRDTSIIWNNLSKNPHAIPLLEKNPEKINWIYLSENPAAIPILKKNLEKVNWISLSRNPVAISILEENADKINWLSLSENPNAIPLLEKHPYKINGHYLSSNPAAIPLLKKYPEKINWSEFFRNPNAIHVIKDILDENRGVELKKELEEMSWNYLSLNPHAIPILEKYPEKINWRFLSKNPAAIPLLEKYPEKIVWETLSSNPAAIPLLEKNLDKIDWDNLSENPAAIPLLEKNLDKMNWMNLSKNPNIFGSYTEIENRILPYHGELYDKNFHPKNPLFPTVSDIEEFGTTAEHANRIDMSIQKHNKEKTNERRLLEMKKVVENEEKNAPFHKKISKNVRNSLNETVSAILRKKKRPVLTKTAKNPTNKIVSVEQEFSNVHLGPSRISWGVSPQRIQLDR